MTIIATINFRNGIIDNDSAHKVSSKKVASEICDYLNIYDYTRQRNHKWNIVNLEDYGERKQKNILAIAERQGFIIRDGELIEQKKW